MNNSNARFTDGRIPDAGIRQLFNDHHHWQRWLDVEVALAQAEASLGIIPEAAAKAIAAKASIEKLGTEKIRAEILKTSHPLMAIVTALSKATGKEYGGWVHWGATTQNITQTGDALIVREAHHIFLSLLGETFEALASLADQTKDMPCPGRTHGQHAVPITFGYKVAGWIDELDRHIDRLHQLEPRMFTVMIGGAVGNYASLGQLGPAVQQDMATILGLESMLIPSRAMADCQAEYVSVLGLLAGTIGRIAKEVYILMQPEFDEAYEPIPDGTIGSSTMPHKRNPQLADDCIAISAEIRSLVPLAMESVLHDHEVSGAYSSMTDEALRQACILTGDLLTRIRVIMSGLHLNPERMRKNLELTGGLINSEAIMLSLGKRIGRQTAHEVVYDAAQAVSHGETSFEEALKHDKRISSNLSAVELQQLLDPTGRLGLSSQLATTMRGVAVRRAHELIQT